MRRILLVSPKPPPLQYLRISQLRSLRDKTYMVPLSIATIAALTPNDVEVNLWDEAVHGKIDENTNLPDYDLVGLTGYRFHLPRAREIAQEIRRRGITVVIGGAGVSSVPESCRDDFDILFIGESELIWPQFIREWKSGSYRREYRQFPKPDLSLSPPPRWDSIADQMHNYIVGAVQTTRGCPFNCEFCDVTYLLGRWTRCKPIDRVLEEISNLERLGIQRIFFCDDNFIGKPDYAKELLRELISLNSSFRRPLEFLTQLPVNVATDDEMLSLLADANFSSLFIGIETPNKESLRETHKYQNIRGDLIENCRKIQSYGLIIRAGMIVGFDHDTPGIFNEQFEFLQEAGITLISLHALKAPIGTDLWYRLKEEGRLLVPNESRFLKDAFGMTNIIPKQMSRIDLFSGYRSLQERLFDWNNFAERVKRMISSVEREPNVPKRKRQLRRLLEIPRLLFSVDKDTRRVIRDILQYTRQHAPFMMPKVFMMIIQQYGCAATAQASYERFGNLIELEKAIDPGQFVDRSGMLVPKSFEKPYREVFPDVYQRIYQGLADKTRVYEVLIEVFTGFLTRWGHTAIGKNPSNPSEKIGFSDQHRAVLKDLTDHIIAKENDLKSTMSESEMAVVRSLNTVHSDKTVPDIKQTRLAEEILKAVQKELCSA